MSFYTEREMKAFLHCRDLYLEALRLENMPQEDETLEFRRYYAREIESRKHFNRQQAWKEWQQIAKYVVNPELIYDSIEEHLESTRQKDFVPVQPICFSKAQTGIHLFDFVVSCIRPECLSDVRGRLLEKRDVTDDVDSELFCVLREMVKNEQTAWEKLMESLPDSKEVLATLYEKLFLVVPLFLVNLSIKDDQEEHTRSEKVGCFEKPWHFVKPPYNGALETWEEFLSRLSPQNFMPTEKWSTLFFCVPTVVQGYKQEKHVSCLYESIYSKHMTKEEYLQFKEEPLRITLPPPSICKEDQIMKQRTKEEMENLWKERMTLTDLEKSVLRKARGLLDYQIFWHSLDNPIFENVPVSIDDLRKGNIFVSYKEKTVKGFVLKREMMRFSTHISLHNHRSFLEIPKRAIDFLCKRPNFMVGMRGEEGLTVRESMYNIHRHRYEGGVCMIGPSNENVTTIYFSSGIIFEFDVRNEDVCKLQDDSESVINEWIKNKTNILAAYWVNPLNCLAFPISLEDVRQKLISSSKCSLCERNIDPETSFSLPALPFCVSYSHYEYECTSVTFYRKRIDPLFNLCDSCIEKEVSLQRAEVFGI